MSTQIANCHPVKILRNIGPLSNVCMKIWPSVYCLDILPKYHVIHTVVAYKITNMRDAAHCNVDSSNR